MSDAYILDAVRTPRGRGKADKGALSGIHPQELLAQALNGLAGRTGIDPAEIDDVVIGCVSQTGEQGANVARNAVLAAGWPIEVTGVSLNRFCGSGLQAVSFAAMGVASGFQRLVVAGGVESMSRNPIGSDGAGQDGDNSQLREAALPGPSGDQRRPDRDARRLLAGGDRRLRPGVAAPRRAGRTGRPVPQPRSGARSGVRADSPGARRALAARDDRRGLSRALSPSFATMGEAWDPIALQRYPQAGQIRHLHTAGNSSGVVDGAAAVLLASADYVRAHDLAAASPDPRPGHRGQRAGDHADRSHPGRRREPWSRPACSRRDIDLWEINEAFAAVPIQTIRNLGIDPERVNVNGGAIALGHPLGATGAMLLGTALDELERRGLGTALVTLCIGGGQGIAAIVERI